jgi:hypothetical protein
MGGEIEVSSQPGKGSTFQFELPLEWHRRGRPGEAAADAPRRRPGAGTSRPGACWWSTTQEVNRKLLVKLFQPVGFEVREAANGVEALAVWEAWEPHLIWMDMRMPVMDGYEPPGASRPRRAAWPRHHRPDRQRPGGRPGGDPLGGLRRLRAQAFPRGGPVRRRRPPSGRALSLRGDRAGDREASSAATTKRWRRSSARLSRPGWPSWSARPSWATSRHRPPGWPGRRPAARPGREITRLARQFEHERILAAIHRPREAAP